MHIMHMTDCESMTKGPMEEGRRVEFSAQDGAWRLASCTMHGRHPTHTCKSRPASSPRAAPGAQQDHCHCRAGLSLPHHHR